jgi:GNAT superfamily N-acetyltransferase
MLTIERVPELSPLRHAIYRLRYEVFSDELHHQSKFVDHESRTIRDPLDENCQLFAAVVDGEVVGTIRGNVAAESDLEESYTDMGIHGGDFEDASVTSKLAVALSHRGTTVAYRLASAALVYGLNNGVRFNIIRCEPHLVPFYERLGFKVKHRISHLYAEWGEGVVMVLDLHDEQHLRQVGSPFLKHYLAWSARQAEEAVAA